MVRPLLKPMHGIVAVRSAGCRVHSFPTPTRGKPVPRGSDRSEPLERASSVGGARPVRNPVGSVRSPAGVRVPSRQRAGSQHGGPRSERDPSRPFGAPVSTHTTLGPTIYPSGNRLVNTVDDGFRRVSAASVGSRPRQPAGSLRELCGCAPIARTESVLVSVARSPHDADRRVRGTRSAVRLYLRVHHRRRCQTRRAPAGRRHPMPELSVSRAYATPADHSGCGRRRRRTRLPRTSVRTARPVPDRARNPAATHDDARHLRPARRPVAARYPPFGVSGRPPPRPWRRPPYRVARPSAFDTLVDARFVYGYAGRVPRGPTVRRFTLN